jgi:hypothetical protein
MPRLFGRDCNVLDQLLSLDIGHTVNTGDTITIRYSISFMLARRFVGWQAWAC